MYKTFFPVVLSLSIAFGLSATDQCPGQDRDAKSLELKIQDALKNILDDEIQGEFADVLDRLARRVEDEMNQLLDDEQIKGLAEAIENGDFPGLMKQLDIQPSFSVGLHLRRVDNDGQQQLAVVEVVEDSPAARAGFKAGDVVQSVNDREIESIADLIKIVKRSGGSELKFQVQRDAMAEIIRVKPAMQIAGMPIDPAHAKQLEMLLGALQGNVPHLGDIGEIEKMLEGLLGDFDQPGNRLKPRLKVRPKPSFDQLPDNVSLTVVKSGKEPTKIIVSRDDQVWEITEAEIDELPAELRPYVRHAVGAPATGAEKDHRVIEKVREVDDIRQQLKKLKAEMEAVEKSLKDK